MTALMTYRSCPGRRFSADLHAIALEVGGRVVYDLYGRENDPNPAERANEVAYRAARATIPEGDWYGA